jgi:hypothetical protein
VIATDNVNLFSYNSLRSATRNFHPSNRIGGGGFGVVYKVSLHRFRVAFVVTAASVESTIRWWFSHKDVVFFFCFSYVGDDYIVLAAFYAFAGTRTTLLRKQKETESMLADSFMNLRIP